MVVFYACLSDVLRGFWVVVYEWLECVWHLIRVHLCRTGPEGSRRPSVLAVAESVQRLPEFCRSVVGQEDVKSKGLAHVIVLD
ncbi:hypothetical protein MANES_12G098140v8 [Manihot esculenta]|uniref:Uncharacterized protein n=1 Tax=Manihot esculenta TaxID=3983 RepID=A0ACB7GV45_MANES|nr:hypothetical protein MANES_12G098140v8 [Manihot esculenta]